MRYPVNVIEVVWPLLGDTIYDRGDK